MKLGVSLSSAKSEDPFSGDSLSGTVSKASFSRSIRLVSGARDLLRSLHGTNRVGQPGRRGVAREKDFPTRFEARRQRTESPRPPALRRAFAKGPRVSSALPHRR